MRNLNTLTIYVEGGNRNSRASRLACQGAFKKLLERAGLPPGNFRIEACGGRQQAYEDFCFALKNGENVLLLVDSEDPVATDAGSGRPVAAWQHLTERATDTLVRPVTATDAQAQLMVPTMEAWLLADQAQLGAYYRGMHGRGAFNEAALPGRADVEQLRKADINRVLENATRSNKTKGIYHKGNHSFEILQTLHPQEIAQRSYHFRRLLCHLGKVLKATIAWLNCTDFEKHTD